MQRRAGSSQPPKAPGVRATTRWRKRYALIAATLILGATLVHYDWARVGTHLIAARWSGVPAPTNLNLGAYRAVIEAKPIAGLTRNASDLTFSSTTGTLFGVINRSAEVFELSAAGELLRRIPLPAAKDPEGISHVAGDLFVISDESDNRLHWVRIAAGARTATPVRVTQPALGFRNWPNLGLEGVAWDATRSELWVVNEKWPRRVIAIRGLAPATAHASDAHVTDWRPKTGSIPLGGDLAGLAIAPHTGNPLLLSEASALVTEYSRSGDILGILPLWRGTSGLARTAPQPEGIALGPDGSIYVLSEPNLFHRFIKTGRSGIQSRKQSAP